MTTSGNKLHDGESAGNVPKAVVVRLSLYLRELQRLQQEGKKTTNSTQLGQLLGVTDAQIRKDLAYFGQFGYPGIGYRCEELVSEIKQILGTNQDWPVALIGVGNLGRALLGYKGFAAQGFRIVAAFDIDPQVAGSKFTDVPVFHLDELPERAKNLKIRLAIVTVPTTAVGEVTEKLVEAGIDGILNFAPVIVSSQAAVHIQSVDLAIELEQLSFAVNHQIETTSQNEPPSP